MEKKELLNFSPVRYFDNATSANLKAGELGLIAAKKGLGKTSVLVQFGIDTLLNDKNLIHVSFDQQSSNVIAWYSSVMAEIAKKKSLNLNSLNEEIVKNRTILNFNQETFTLPKVVNTLKSLKEGGINLSLIIVDGLNFSTVNEKDISCFSEFIKSEKLTAWFSYTNNSDSTDLLKDSKLKCFTTIGTLCAEGNSLYLEIIKNGSGKVNLDSKTVLFTK